jgi:hypothetical protein
MRKSIQNMRVYDHTSILKQEHKILPNTDIITLKKVRKFQVIFETKGAIAMLHLRNGIMELTKEKGLIGIENDQDPVDPISNVVLLVERDKTSQILMEAKKLMTT